MQLPAMLEGPSLTRLIQGAVFGAIATIVVGFQWGGWTLGSTHMKAVNDAEQSAVVRVLAPICVDKFRRDASATANLEALKKADSWKRDDFIKKAGWATFPGSEPDSKVAEACATMLQAK